MIDSGGPAPDFTLDDQDGNPVTLSDLRGRWALVYFYPKADTPGCTAQACSARDHSADYEAANALVLGVSPDSVADLRKFADKYGLAFTLLSDEGGKSPSSTASGSRRADTGASTSATSARASWSTRRATSRACSRT